ncbi:MAG: FHA domain-containing protein [bacterium]|nr:FHA domain-containing protein [bacterium]
MTASARPTAPSSAQAESDALDGTILDMMAEGVSRFTKNNPLEGLEIGFVFLEGPNKGKGYRVKKTPTLIGRTTGDVIIPDGRISRKHAQLDVLGPSQYSLKDLASTNGTVVNDRPISTTRLENGDVVSFGGTKFRFVVRTMRAATKGGTGSN